MCKGKLPYTRKYWHSKNFRFYSKSSFFKYGRNFNLVEPFKHVMSTIVRKMLVCFYFADSNIDRQIAKFTSYTVFSATSVLNLIEILPHNFVRKLRSLARGYSERSKTSALKSETLSASPSTPPCPPLSSSEFSSPLPTTSPTEPSVARWWCRPT